MRSQAGQAMSGSCIPGKRLLSSRVVLGHFQPLGRGESSLVIAWHEADHICVVLRLRIKYPRCKVFIM